DHDLTAEETTARGRVRVVLAACFCATGGALIVHIVSRVSLALAALVLLAMAALVFTLLLRRLDPVRAAAVRRRLFVGAASGLVAPLAYDASRYGTVALFELSFRPFHAFQLFGKGLLGPEVEGFPAYAAGTVFHLLNGTGFGIAFAMLVRKPNIWKGIL